MANFLGKALKFTVGAALVTGAAAAAGLCYGLKKWSDDEDSDEIKVTTGGRYGVQIAKTNDGKFVVNTKYDWATDPKYGEEREGGIIIDISDKNDDDKVIEIPTADGVKNMVKDAFADAKDAVIGAKEDIADAAEDVIDDVKDAAEDAADKMEDVKEDVAEAVEEAVEDVKEDLE